MASYIPRNASNFNFTAKASTFYHKNNIKWHSNIALIYNYIGFTETKQADSTLLFKLTVYNLTSPHRNAINGSWITRDKL